MLVFCQQLDAKLRALYEAFDANPGLTPSIRSDADLGRYLGIGKGTVSAIRNGNSQKGRDPFRLQPAQLDALAKVVALVLCQGSVTENPSDDLLKEARGLLTAGDAERFRQRLRALPTDTIETVLAVKPATIEVSITLVRNGFFISPEQYEPVPDEVIIGVRQRFTVHVSSRRDFLLIVLATNSDGWSWLVPGPTHDGKVRSSPERIPAKLAWSYGSGAGPGAFVVIELPATAPVHRRDRSEPTVLTDERRTALVSILTDPVYRDRWSWGRKAYFIKPQDCPGD